MINKLCRRMFAFVPCSRCFRKSSYSQCGEDIIISFIFETIKIKKPSYLDVGANHPFSLNNTFLFYKQGSRGINIEPDPFLHKQLCKLRPHDINLQLGIGCERSISDFFVMSTRTLNTFSRAEAEKNAAMWGHKIDDTIKVEINTINNIINKYNNGISPDLLSIDAEGLDHSIIKSINYSESKPKVICVETLEYTETGMPKKDQHIGSFLETKGYFLFADTHINSIFVLRDLWVNR